MNVVPVSLGSNHGGLTSSTGLLREEADDLVLEYQITDGFVGLLKSDVKEARIPRRLISSINLNTGWFGNGKIVIQMAQMRPIAEVPGMTHGRLVLAVALQDRTAAEKFVANLNAAGQPTDKPTPIDSGLE